MKKALLSLIVISISALGLAAKGGDNDPVLMTVNKKPVKLSEFEYLYQKNNAQQLATQPIDEYLDLFVIYKLKVADAEAAGIDKTEAFENEFAGYRRDLSEPYLTDAAARDSLVHLIYERLDQEVDVSHIMIERGKDAASAEAQKAKLNDIRDQILAGKVTFEQMADSVSIDPAKTRNHGHQGYISGGMFPYTFEDAAFLTPVGEISPVIETPYGYHIVKVHGRRNSPGQVKVQHILKLTADFTPEEQAVKKAQIDSIYNLLIAGANFDSIAVMESEDPGSARKGGVLDWFTTGRMVPEFEKVAFELQNGEISKPFQTSYGWHIIHKLDSRGLDPYDVMAPRISQFIDRDERQYIPIRAKKAQLRAKYNATVDQKVLNSILDEIKAAGSLDSTLVKRFSADSREIIKLNGKNDGATVASIFEVFPSPFETLCVEEATAVINTRLDEVADEIVVETERNNLAVENAEFRNLLNEYRDGMLLFEISDRNVWSKSKNDTDGLNNYFLANKDKYAKWPVPKFKGYIVFATSDSIGQLARKALADNNVKGENAAEFLRGKFGKEIKVERVLAAKGENAIIDGIAFGGEHQQTTGKWVDYFPYFYSIIEQPEEPADERGAVTTDYQNALEQEWVNQLRKRYPVKINKKVLEQYKKSLPAAE